MDGGKFIVISWPIYRWVCANSNNAQLYQETQLRTQTQYDRSGDAVRTADAEIARFQEILRQIEELRSEFDEIRRIGETIKSFRARDDGNRRSPPSIYTLTHRSGEAALVDELSGPGS